MFRTLVAAALVVGVTVTDPRVVTHLDLAAGQQPENLVVDADGSVDTTFSFSRQIAHISADGTLYFLYAAGTSDLTGLWRPPPGGVPTRVAPLPASNGLALDDGHAVWVTNFTQGAMLRIPFDDGPIRTVATGLDTPDDFDFAGPDALAATNPTKSLELVRSHRTVGLSSAGPGRTGWATRCRRRAHGRR